MNGHRFWRGVAGLAAVGVLAGATVQSPGASAAQAPEKKAPGLERRNPGPAAQRGEDQITLDANLVVLDVSVVDRGNRPIYDIPKERFAVFEDGSQQQIDFFSKEQAPVSLALAIDTSGSMRSKIEAVIEAVTNLVHENKPTDETAVIEFKNEIELTQEFTSNTHDVEDALDNVIANGQTALLDAIMLSSKYVQDEGRHRRKALVVVTDGLEKDSYYSLEQVVNQMREYDVRLYLIGFTQDLEQSSGLFKRSQKAKAEELLNKLAEETGGRSFFPKDLSELGPITDQIAKDLRTVYAIGYYPTNTKKDGTFRKVEVKVTSGSAKNDPKLVARTRSGYYADKE